MGPIAAVLHWSGSEQTEATALLSGGMRRQLQALDGRLAIAAAAGACLERVGTLLVAFWGRFHDRDRLLAQLAARGAAPEGATDAHVAAACYRAWGGDFAGPVLGDYAVLLWDERRRELLCVVDGMGARQLYYTRTRSCVAFAASEEVLLRVPGVSREPDEETIAIALVPELRDAQANRTWLRDVSVTCPGETIRVSAHGDWRSTRQDVLSLGTELKFRNADEAGDAFLDVMDRAVSDRTDHHAGQLLSGGIDSAAVLGSLLAGDRAVTSFSVVADDDPSCVETRCIRTMTASCHPHLVALPSFDGADQGEFLREVWQGAHPCDNSMGLPLLAMLQAGRAGARTLLHGASGDVTLWTPHRYGAALVTAGAWRAAWREARLASANHNYLYGTPPWRLFALSAWHSAAPAALRNSVARSRSPAMRAPAHLAPDFARRMRIAQRLGSQRERELSPASFRSSWAEQHLALLKSPFGPSLGLGGYGRLGVRLGLEIADPWADRRVVSFFMHCPVSLKVSGGWTKYLVRRALASRIDRSVLWRFGKEHLGWKVTEALMLASAVRLAPISAAVSQAVRPYLAESSANSLQRYVQKPDASPFEDTLAAYNTASLGLWLHRVTHGSALL